MTKKKGTLKRVVSKNMNFKQTYIWVGVKFQSCLKKVQHCVVSKTLRIFIPTLRAMFITSLANNPNLSIKKIMSSSCHCSVTSSASYTVADGESKSNKFAALGMERSPLKRRKVDDKDDAIDGMVFCCVVYCWEKILPSKNVSEFIFYHRY